MVQAVAWGGKDKKCPRFSESTKGSGEPGHRWGGKGRRGREMRVALGRFQVMKFLKTLSLKLRRNTERSYFIFQRGSDKI